MGMAIRCSARSRRSASSPPARSRTRARRHPAGRARRGRSRRGEARPAGGVVGGRPSRRATGRAKCRPAEPRRRRVPRVVAAGGEYARRTGGGGHPHVAPILPRSLGRCSSTSGAAPGDESSPTASTCGRRASATTPVAGGSGASAANRSGSISHTSAATLAPDPAPGIRRQASQRRGVTGDGELDDRAEAQRVLQRVEAFEHGQRRVAPGRPEACGVRALRIGGHVVRSRIKLRGRRSARRGDAVVEPRVLEPGRLLMQDHLGGRGRPRTARPRWRR